VLVEAAWAYQHRPNVIGFLLRRQKSLAISEQAKDIAWKAPQRLHKRYKAMAARGQKQKPDRDGNRTRNAGFHLGHCGRNGKAAQARKSRLREAFLTNWTAAPMTAQGTTKSRTLLTFCAERFPNPTRVLSPRQLPTDHDHAVPTREYQSDPSSRLLLGCHRPCCPKPNPLQAHPQERVPAPPPVEVMVGATTVLTVTGSLRRAQMRRALDGAPFRPDGNCDGRLRREHFPSPRGPTKTNPSNYLGLDRSLHIRR
jgi:hypothetical protein